MAERDEFDKIVEGLDLDLSFPDEPADPVVPDPVPQAEVDDPIEDEEPFYRRVDPTPLIPRRRGILLAWAGVVGAPLSLVLATVAHIYLDRPVLAAAALIFVASATYLFLQLPEHGPSRRDWPDDGAVL
ncbi:hypothetical protein [Aeromicrobium sp. UC242_57]|uniref:hypothetical protein n=1 Tax=Aeromicrobium sp. UC242_57 TaxID=3374624 RepID=UPI003787AC93